MKGLLLVSGGIDSPVAGHLMMEQGADVDMLHFYNRDIRKVKKLAAVLGKLHNKKIKLSLIDHKKIIEKIMNCNRRMTCVLCKRFMFRIAEEIAINQGYDFIITGDNLGQVASQTLDNLTAITADIKVPILRPLLSMDKNETTAIAKEIGTYDISIEKTPGCNAAPKYPVTVTTAKKIDEEMKKIDEEGIIREAIKEMKVEEV